MLGKGNPNAVAASPAVWRVSGPRGPARSLGLKSDMGRRHGLLEQIAQLVRQAGSSGSKAKARKAIRLRGRVLESLSAYRSIRIRRQPPLKAAASQSRAEG